MFRPAKDPVSTDSPGSATLVSSNWNYRVRRPYTAIRTDLPPDILRGLVLAVPAAPPGISRENLNYREGQSAYSLKTPRPSISIYKGSLQMELRVTSNAFCSPSKICESLSTGVLSVCPSLFKFSLGISMHKKSTSD